MVSGTLLISCYRALVALELGGIYLSSSQNIRFLRTYYSPQLLLRAGRRFGISDEDIVRGLTGEFCF